MRGTTGGQGRLGPGGWGTEEGGTCIHACWGCWRGAAHSTWGREHSRQDREGTVPERLGDAEGGRGSEPVGRGVVGLAEGSSDSST